MRSMLAHLVPLALTVAIPVIGEVGEANAQALFEDGTGSMGLSGYVAQAGDGHGPGAVFTDLDQDGFPDLYVMRSWGNPNRLYRNVDGGGGMRQFQPVPDDGGAGDSGNATGAIAGDYDNDGDLDLYVINFDQPNALYQSQLAQTGTLTFIDVTAATDPSPADDVDGQYGVGSAWHEGIPLDNSLTAAWADVDRDGDLDLYVGNHNGYFGTVPEGPFNVPGRRDVFYINNGDGTFTDATMLYGMTGYEAENGSYIIDAQRFSSSNAVIFADFDNDRWTDLLVTNKVGGPPDRDMLYLNQGVDGDGTWLGYETVTYDLNPTFGHTSGAAMGVDVADMDNDGDLDIYITDWSDLESPPSTGPNDLWINQLTETGELHFIHSQAAPAVYSWGAQWQDFNLDGRMDLHVATEGSVPDRLYMNLPGGLVDIAAAAGVGQVRNSRGDVTADYDRDGWIDLFVVNLDGGSSVLYRNVSSTVAGPRHFLSVLLKGDPNAPGPQRSTRDAIGARVNVVADIDGNGVITQGDVQRREVVSGSSNAASTSSLEVEFGLGSATAPALEILWPSGRRSVFAVAADQFLVIDETSLREGDINADGVVNVGDLVAVITTWGPCPAPPALCPTDLDGNGVVDVNDLVTVIVGWGP